MRSKRTRAKDSYRYPVLVVAALCAAGVPAEAQVNISQACTEQARKGVDFGPTSVRLIDTDCSQLKPVVAGSSLVDKNARSQVMHGVAALRDSDLWGQGIKVGIWDAGHVLDRHVELAGRVSYGDPDRTRQIDGGTIPVPLNEHSTHVAGTIGASGSLQQSSQGMAPRANIVSFFWGDRGEDVQDLKSAVSLGISVTNHSYGAPAGWTIGGRGWCQENWTWLGRDGDSTDVRFGAYDVTTRDFDNAVWQNKALSVFVAAGNERNETADPEKFRNDPRPWAIFTGAHCIFRDGDWVSSSDPRKSDLSKNGFDTISGRGLGKNVITVGAAVFLEAPYDEKDIRPTYFSSMGPADDGRIKPDVLANGDDLYSTFLPERCQREMEACYSRDLTTVELQRYAVLPGTSMATPIATGIAALLNQQSQRGIRGRVLFADEMKAALVHTAKSPTGDGRPSYRWGWGLIDAFQAAQLVGGRSGRLTRTELSGDGTTEITLGWEDRDRPLVLTAVWLDEPGDVPATLVIDDRTPKLVNRLDVQLVSPSDKRYFPWSLNPEAPERVATNQSANLIDNVQRIDVGPAAWEAGTWRLVIKPAQSRAAKLELAIAVNKAATLGKM
jgi:subtilisin family serine protease